MGQTKRAGKSVLGTDIQFTRPLGTSGSMLLLMNSTLIATRNKREKQPTSSTGSSGIRWNQSASIGLMGLGLKWKQELSEKSSMCLTNHGRSNFVKNVVVFIQSKNKETNINQKYCGHGLCDEIDSITQRKIYKASFWFQKK